MIRPIVAALIGALLSLSSSLAATTVPVEAMDVRVRPITQFRIGSDEKTFGPLEFLGGLEMTSRASRFGSFSGFRFLEPGASFIGVADTGFWFFGSIVRDAEGRPSAVTDFRMMPMVDGRGEVVGSKWEVDAEGIDVRNGIATVSFERNHRVAQFRIDPAGMGPPMGKLDILLPKSELRQNRGFETVAHAHPHGQHEGAVVVVSERSLDARGNIFAATLEGPNRGIFTVRRSDEFDVTDGTFLPDGDLLLLERSFSMARGVRMRLRRIYGESVTRGSIADGPVLLEADMGYQIDNMEAMDVWRRADGALIVSLMSDDNQSILQRNLYLEFRLAE